MGRRFGLGDLGRGEGEGDKGRGEVPEKQTIPHAAVSLNTFQLCPETMLLKHVMNIQVQPMNPQTFTLT